MDNQPIPWDEFVLTYNRIAKTIFKTPTELITYLYSKHHTLEGVGDILGIAGQTVGKYMHMWGLPLKPKGHRGTSLLHKAYINMDKTDLTNIQIAKILNCSVGYISYLKKYHK